MGNITYEIIEHIGVLSQNKNYKKEINRVSWNGGQAKIDIRQWNEDHTKPGKGITLTEEEAQRLKELL